METIRLRREEDQTRGSTDYINLCRLRTVRSHWRGRQSGSSCFSRSLRVICGGLKCRPSASTRPHLRRGEMSRGEPSRQPLKTTQGVDAVNPPYRRGGSVLECPGCTGAFRPRYRVWLPAPLTVLGCAVRSWGRRSGTSMSLGSSGGESRLLCYSLCYSQSSACSPASLAGSILRSEPAFLHTSHTLTHQRIHKLPWGEHS